MYEYATNLNFKCSSSGIPLLGLSSVLSFLHGYDWSARCIRLRPHCHEVPVGAILGAAVSMKQAISFSIPWWTTKYADNFRSYHGRNIAIKICRRVHASAAFIVTCVQGKSSVVTSFLIAKGVRLLLLNHSGTPSRIDFHAVDVSAKFWCVSHEKFVKAGTFVFPSDEATESIGI